MKIIIASFFNNSENGGWAKVANSMAKELCRRGHSVMFVCPGDKTKLVEETNNLSIFYIGSYIKGDVAISNFSSIKIRKIYRIFDEFNPDIIHSHGIDNIGMLVQNYCILAKKPNVLTPHILLGESNKYFGPKTTKTKTFQKVTYFFIKEYLKQTDGVIALTSEMRKHLEKYKFKGKIKDIPNAIELERFLKLGIDNKYLSRTLCTIGHISIRKNQGFLVESMKFLPEYKLKLAGNDMDLDYANMVRTGIKGELVERIEFLGNIEYDKIPELLKESKVFVMSSKSEVQSLAIIEALASGTPVVALAESSTKTWVPDCVKLVDAEASPKDFAQVVDEVLTLNQDDYVELCKISRESSLKHSWDSVIDKTVEFYKEVIKNYELVKSSGNVFTRFAKDARKNSKYRTLFIIISNLLLVVILFGKLSNIFSKKKDIT